jgi:hypothetical protein
MVKSFPYLHQNCLRISMLSKRFFVPREKKVMRICIFRLRGVKFRVPHRETFMVEWPWAQTAKLDDNFLFNWLNVIAYTLGQWSNIEH